MYVGISQRIDNILSYCEKRDALDQRMVSWVAGIGLIPILIPNSLADERLPVNKQSLLKKWLKMMRLDAIILSIGVPPTNSVKVVLK